MIRAAKESLNGIDPVDVKRSYRFEQGFTFELNLSGVADEARDAFVEKRDADNRDVSDHGRQAHDRGRGRRASCATGMTIGIGGWGSRRKPMSLVRAIAALATSRTSPIVSYGGPDVGLLCAAGKVRKVVYGFVSLDSIPLEPHFRAARQSGAIEADRARRGHVPARASRPRRWRVPFLPTRAGLGSDLLDVKPELKTVTSPYDDGEELVAVPALAPRRRARST